MSEINSDKKHSAAKDKLAVTYDSILYSMQQNNNSFTVYIIANGRVTEIVIPIKISKKQPIFFIYIKC